MALLLCGFAGFFGTQIIKVFSPVRLLDRTKLFFVVAISTGCSSALFTHKPADLVIYGVAGAGLAVLVHKATRLLSLLGDSTAFDELRKRGTPR